MRGATIVFCLLLACCMQTWASAPQVFQDPYHESPVQAGPDDLIFLGGLGFAPDDRVVYRAIGGRDASAHPAEVPTTSTSESGTARVLRMDDPAYALTINLPEQIDAERSYQLWVVNATGEWSKPFSINDPRPLWFTPDFAFTSAQHARLERQLRVIGRNLAVHSGEIRVRLRGPREYLLPGTNPDAAQADPQNRASGLRNFVIEAALPGKLVAGLYAVSIKVNDAGWVDVPEQKLQILDDPRPLPTFRLGDPPFGGCRPDDGQDDRNCLAKALAAAQRAGGGIVEIPQGTWDVLPSSTPAEPDSELVVSPQVQLRGAGSESTQILWHDGARSSDMGALLLLEGDNSITALQFQDQRHFDTRGRSRPVIELGHYAGDSRVIAGQLPSVVRSIVIADNEFRHVGTAIGSGTLPIQRLFVVRNRFAGFAEDMYLPGSHLTVANPFTIDDSVIRWNHFIPGSYLDVKSRQGVIATELGASHRLDFSSNVADGASRQGLQEPADQPGWRAGFFWNMTNNSEQLLVSDNEITCPGDKSGDGEAISFDNNGDAEAYSGVQPVDAAQPAGLWVRGKPLTRQGEQFAQRRVISDMLSGYRGHWIQVVGGPGLGQVRKIGNVRWDSASGRTEFQVDPPWDVVPLPGESSVLITRQYWQAYVVANFIDQSAPRCTKSNLNGPRGGMISIYAPTIDSTIQFNRLLDSDGIGVAHSYEVPGPGCPQCSLAAMFQTALDVRANVIEGEYDWSSDCSNSGLRANFGAAPTSQAPPPTLGFGVQFSHNLISHADGLRGGAIDVDPVWFTGPTPGRWRLIDNLIIAHNVVRDVNGPAPRSDCKLGQRGRPGIHLQGPGNVQGTVLYKNRCERVNQPLTDLATATLRACGAMRGGDDCACP